MISRLLYALQAGFNYVRKNPQIYVGLLLVVVLPLLFLYTGQKFLDAARSNQDRLQKDKVGLLHDSIVVLERSGAVDRSVIQDQIEYLASINPDITNFKVLTSENRQIVPIVSLSTTSIGVAEKQVDLYQNAAVRFDDSVIFEFYVDGGRYWQAFRAFEGPTGKIMFVFTEHNLAITDAVIAKNEKEAYLSLLLVYLFVLVIAWWLIKNTDYRHLYKEAQDAIKTKDLFTNMIAHELRAPLTAMRGYASMITEADDARKEDREHANRVSQASERLLNIVNDLLDVARIQSGKLSVELTEVDLSVIVNAVADELRVSATEKKLSLACAGTEQSHLAAADPKRLHQALTNLVSNSIKYTKEGTIEVSIEEKNQNFEIRIKDNGMGISAADQQKLFAPFYRVNSKDVSQVTGTGLGMWITRQLLELMGASIAVESIKGVGTHIVVTVAKFDNS